MVYYSSGSACPFPRRANVTTASAIATPIAEPNAATLASAICKNQVSGSYITLPIFFSFIEIIIIFDFYDTMFMSEIPSKKFFFFFRIIIFQIRR